MFELSQATIWTVWLIVVVVILFIGRYFWKKVDTMHNDCFSTASPTWLYQREVEAIALEKRKKISKGV